MPFKVGSFYKINKEALFDNKIMFYATYIKNIGEVYKVLEIKEITTRNNVIYYKLKFDKEPPSGIDSVYHKDPNENKSILIPCLNLIQEEMEL